MAFLIDTKLRALGKGYTAQAMRPPNLLGALFF